MEKRHSQLIHGQPMEQTRGLSCTCDSGVNHNTRGEFNNTSDLALVCMIITLLNDSERLLNSA